MSNLNNTQTEMNALLDRIPEECLAYDSLVFAITSEIYSVMEEKGITQKQLARLLGVSEASISKSLSGDQNLTLKTIAKMLHAIGSALFVKAVDKNVDFDWLHSVLAAKKHTGPQMGNDPKKGMIKYKHPTFFMDWNHVPLAA